MMSVRFFCYGGHRPLLFLLSNSRVVSRSATIRYLSSPPRNSLLSTVSPISTYWQQRFPTSIKYFSLILAAAGTLRYVHPNVLVTVGPPLAIGSWFLNKWFKRSYLYKREILKIYPDSLAKAENENNQISIKLYDESDIDNVLAGIENEYDSFKAQLIPLVEQKLINYAIYKRHQQSANKVLDLFCTGSDLNQVSCKLGKDFETMVMLPLKEDYLPYNGYQRALMEETATVKFDSFLKASVPLYTSHDTNTRKRLATVEVYLLQHSPQDDVESDTKSNETVYNIAVSITKYGLFDHLNLTITDFETDGLMKSHQFNEKEKDEDFIDI